jgi:aryl-alcohol dehydrogenase-like predicted oxidoreductase
MDRPRGGEQPVPPADRYIDLYQMHRPDPDTDIDETLSALSDLIHAGKIRAVGSSTFPAESIVEAQWVADRPAPA